MENTPKISHLHESSRFPVSGARCIIRFGFDGLRWHVRAFCHLDSIFKDFLLPRMIETAAITSTEVSCRDDELWNSSFSVIIIPHPGLGPSQRKVVAMDYGMDSGRSTLQIRYAMLFYVLKRLGLLSEASQEDPRRQHIVVENFDETKAALLRAGFPG